MESETSWEYLMCVSPFLLLSSVWLHTEGSSNILKIPFKRRKRKRTRKRRHWSMRCLW